MSEILEFPLPEDCPFTLQELVQKANNLALNSDNVYIDCPHVKERMHQRHISTRQIFDVLRNGTAKKKNSGPTLDKYGDWRIKLERYSAGKMVQVVVVVKEHHLEVVTVF